MYYADVAFRTDPATNAMVFILPDDARPSDQQGELCVTFRPKKFWPEERSTGAPADFDAAIAKVTVRDIEEGPRSPRAWHSLDPRDLATAKAFLEEHYNDDMWDKAFVETAEAFGYDRHGYDRRAA